MPFASNITQIFATFGCTSITFQTPLHNFMCHFFYRIEHIFSSNFSNWNETIGVCYYYAKHKKTELEHMCADEFGSLWRDHTNQICAHLYFDIFEWFQKDIEFLIRFKLILATFSITFSNVQYCGLRFGLWPKFS